MNEEEELNQSLLLSSNERERERERDLSFSVSINQKKKRILCDDKLLAFKQASKLKGTISAKKGWNEIPQTMMD